MTRKITGILIGTAMLSCAIAPAVAKEEPAATVTKCSASYGTIAITDGDAQGWSQFGLSSPRGLLGAMVQESGCFSLHNPASGVPADYLVSAVAGSQEEIDQTMNVAKGAITEGLIRSGAAGSMLGSVPFAGGMLGMFGGLGGKKKTITAGLRLMSPMNGQTLITGTGQSQKSTIKLLDSSDWLASSSGAAGQYATTKDGKMVTSAFVQAYNAMVGQAGMLASVPKVAPPAPAAAMLTVAADAMLYSKPDKTSASVRTLRAGTTLNPTGKREGLFVEVTDNFGTQGWASIEDLK